MLEHICNPGTWDVRGRSSRPTWATGDPVYKQTTQQIAFLSILGRAEESKWALFSFLASELDSSPGRIAASGRPDVCCNHSSFCMVPHLESPLPREP